MNPRKRISRAQRERIYQRSGGHCQCCGEPIGIDAFHVAHLRSHTHGGAAVDENLEAWCLPCNLRQGAEDVRDTRTSPRAWQVEALDRVVARITRDGAATVSAAPGAGKTIFAALVFEALHEADVIDRMVVVAPRLTLIGQWHAALRSHRHIELKPGAEVERPGQDGVIVTYQSLSIDTVGIHRRQAELQRTLLVLDEVHHVGESHRDGSRPAWARNVAEFAGEVDGELHVTGVLNLSGTLWRTPRDQRISTVRYKAAVDQYGRPIPNKIESEVDAEVTAERLIGEGQLRPIDLHRIDGRVEMFETAKFELVQSDMADLDEEPARATLRELAAQSSWRQRFVAKVLAQLQAAHTALGRHPVKALIVAATQDDARLFADEVDQQMRDLHLLPLAEIAISDDGPEAAATLERFRRSDRVGVLCCVDMAGEGYDCPDIAVVGYATNKLTHLYAMQVVARAMRVTDAERRMGQVIPAAIVVPEVKVLIDTLKAYLAPISHEIMLEQQTARRDQERGEGDGGGAPRLVDQPYIIESVIPTQERITIPLKDGAATFTVEQIAGVEPYFERYNVPSVLYPRTLAAMADYLSDETQRNPFDPQMTSARDRVTTREQMSIEQISSKQMKELHRLEGWWAKNGDGSIARFIARANAEAGIKNGTRESASAKQLTVALQFERDQIARYCEINNLPLPRRMKGGDNV